MFTGWAALGGTEVINTERARVYAAAGGIEIRCGCPALPAYLGDAPYKSPAGDDAPWYDPARPESGRFYGVVGLTVTGLDKSSITRSPTELAVDGSALGPSRRAGRTISLTLLMTAGDPPALSYGLGWLATALRGSVCGDDYQGDPLCVLTGCPPTAPTGWTGLERTLFQVGVTEGPEVSAYYPLSAGVAAEVEVTLVASVPHIYAPAVPIVEGLQPSRSPIWVDGVFDIGCSPPVDCAADPNCRPAALPPAPPVIPDPCYPTGPYMALRALARVPAKLMPDWGENVPIVTVHTGSAAPRRLQVRFYDNPLDTPCVGQPDPCTACALISTPYLPAGATFTVSGTLEQATLDCAAGGVSTTPPTLYGPGGGVFSWPVFDCGAGLCIEVLAEYTTWARDATVDVAMVNRTDAI